jgi:hypothetical protein
MRYAKLRFAPLLLIAAIGGASCSELRESPTSPEASPQYGVGTYTQAADPLVVRYTHANAESTSAVVGADGGALVVGGHVMTVPKNAVPDATLFTMTVVDGYNIHVDLTAVRLADGALVTRFPRGSEVQLSLSYEYGMVWDDNLLRVGYLVDSTTDGKKQVMKSEIDRNSMRVKASLSHFSQYALLID